MPPSHALGNMSACTVRLHTVVLQNYVSKFAIYYCWWLTLSPICTACFIKEQCKGSENVYKSVDNAQTTMGRINQLFSIPEMLTFWKSMRCLQDTDVIFQHHLIQPHTVTIMASPVVGRSQNRGYCPLSTPVLWPPGDNSLRCSDQRRVSLQEAGAWLLGGGGAGFPTCQEPPTAGQWSPDPTQVDNNTLHQALPSVFRAGPTVWGVMQDTDVIF